MEKVTSLQVAFAGVAATVVGFAITYPLHAHCTRPRALHFCPKSARNLQLRILPAVSLV
jgi:hypothetical protein